MSAVGNRSRKRHTSTNATTTQGEDSLSFEVITDEDGAREVGLTAAGPESCMGWNFIPYGMRAFYRMPDEFGSCLS
jgi:hypothetical protein